MPRGAPRPFVAAAVALILAVLSGGEARAELWQVQDAGSTLEFELVVNQVDSRGRFPTFTGEGRFDPDAPQDSDLTLAIDITRLDLGNALASTFARSVDWFDAEAHPLGSFRLSELEPSPVEGVWLARGELQLRGETRDVEVELALDLTGETARATGETVIDRTLFGIGQGPTSYLVE
ncbi:MAG: YceI family protein, partial [Pseudomonadota bacterium]